MGVEDKLLLEVHHAPVLAHTLNVFQESSYIDDIVLVTRSELIPQVTDMCRLYNFTKVKKIIVGGETRLDSVYNGVFSVAANTEVIAIHDGARPCVNDTIIKHTVQAAMIYHAAAPCIPVSSTLKKVKDGLIIETIDRNELYEVQTPQVFSADLIKAALTNVRKKAIEITDDCMAVELLGVPVHATEGSRMNIKITTADDIAFAETILVELGA